jgi:hypothetical protein
MAPTRLASVLALALIVSTRGLFGSEVFPVDQIKPGMTGVGLTVFEGSRIEEFKVSVIGVLGNAAGPKQSVILARLEGGPLAQTGVIAGMSGSPVYIEGKLVGAVAYGYPFSKETIAGITPIGEMIEATSTLAPRSASAQIRPRLGGGSVDRAAVMAAFQRPLNAVVQSQQPAAGSALPSALAGLQLRPLALPLVFSGFDPATFDWARELFGALGFTPVLGPGPGSTPGGPLPDLAPGSALGISLVEGDIDLSVTGTITHIDRDRVYALGHPFYNLGPTQFPMRKAYVYSVFPSLYQSWKISAPADSVGTVDQDRTTAVAGLIGKPPRMIPVSIRLHTSRGLDRTFALRVVEDELFSPALAYVCLLSVLQTNERAAGTSTVRVEARLRLDGGRAVKVEDVFAEGQPPLQAASLVAAPMAFAMSNEFAKVRVEALEVDVRSYETVRSAALQRVWIERTGPVRPGSTVTLKMLLRGYRGEPITEAVALAVPKTARPGAYSILVADGQTLAAIEQKEMRQAFVPRDLDQLVRALNMLRRNNRIYARLLRPEAGAIVSGEYMQSLPQSILSVLTSAEHGGSVVPIRSAPVWEHEIPVEYAFSGSRSLPLTIER